MSSDSSSPRRRRFIATLQRRQQHLEAQKLAGRANAYDKAELQALTWAIEQLEALMPAAPADVTEKAPSDGLPRP